LIDARGQDGRFSSKASALRGRAQGPQETSMSRPVRDSSWHFLALVIVVAGLGLFAPLTWWNTQPQTGTGWHAQPVRQHSAMPIKYSLGKPRLQASPRIVAPSIPSLTMQTVQFARLAEEPIGFDSSIEETPALPSGPPAHAETRRVSDANDDLRLGAATPRSSQARVSDWVEATPLTQPGLAPNLGPPLTPGSVLPATPAWPHAAALIAQLETLSATTPRAADWVTRVLTQLELITKCPTLADNGARDAITKLRQLADEARPLATSIDHEHARSRVLRAGYAISRRLMIWDQVHGLFDRDDTIAAPIVDRAEWTSALAEVDSLLQATPAGARWRNYLLLDRANGEFDTSACSPADQRRLARDILHRMHSTQLSHEQERFLKSPAFVELGKQLEARAAEAPDLVGLLTAIEQYERDDSSQNARSLAGQLDALRWSPESEIRELADSVNAYYRNANVRVALTADFVNRLLPQQTQVEAVEDVVQGAWVSGRSHTNTRLKLTLLPDKHRWNMGLEAVGEVASNTSSSKGPARFYQDGRSFFRARKRLTVDRRGVRMSSAEAEANTNNSLNDFETDFDGIPLLGGLARSIARNQYDSTQPAAKVEVESKIIVRATSQLDREVTEKLEKAKRDFQTKMVDPLRKLNLEPAAVDMETTSQRLIARYRVAAHDQVSAHTPRPQAPGDSLLSLQIHQTALNNVLDQLALAGRRVELRQLYKEMTDRFAREGTQVPADLPENVYVTFADDDPVRLECNDGLVRLTIRLKELSQGRNHWTNFTVRGYYAPSADQLDANLVREGIIELFGDDRPLPVGQRIALSGIFNKVLSRNRKLNIVNKQIAEARELRDQQVTQFVIHDGWIGIALGPKTPGRQVAMHPRAELHDTSE
jgi:hypothetical protein